MNTKIYNKKGFLVPNSILSMACFHAKVKENGEYQFRLHDCNTGIRLIGNLNDPVQRNEAVKKLYRLAMEAMELGSFIIENY